MAHPRIKQCHLYLIASCDSVPVYHRAGVMRVLTKKGVEAAEKLRKGFAESKVRFDHLRRGDSCVDAQTSVLLLEAMDTRPNRFFSKVPDEYAHTLKSCEATAKLNTFPETNWGHYAKKTVRWFEQSIMQDKRIAREQSAIAIVADPIVILALVVYLTNGRYEEPLEHGSRSKFEWIEDHWFEHYTNLITEPMTNVVPCD